ncbi:MAG: hypothetical protein ACLQU3_12095 [Limisphaerales bacterium]
MGANTRFQTGFADYLDLLRVFDEREAEALIVEAHTSGNCRPALNALQQLLLSTSNREVIKVARAHGFALLQTVPLADLTRSRHAKLLSFVAKRLPAWQQSLGTRSLS